MSTPPESAAHLPTNPQQMTTKLKGSNTSSPLAPEEFYYEGPYLVFTAAYHLKRGYCCKSGCRHCPFGQS